jgi:protein-S-isoprenylcysteine O-methyltransferase Ste14
MKTINFSILLKGIVLIIIGCLLLGLCLFGLAGSFHYWNAWLLIIECLILECGLAVYLFIKNPELFKSRMQNKEKRKNQKIFTSIAYSAIALSITVIPGLDKRYEWSAISASISIVFSVILFISFIFQYVIVGQNKHLFSTVEVKKEQKVINEGLYSVIRHPMYLFGIILVISIPIVLGSIYGFIVSSVFVIPLIVLRIKDEEKVLVMELSGYKEYCEKIKYRLIPFIW